ncbi:MAG: FtsQ-type POTRA domain-containing protein [Candidatus Saganbacteria bacterium]|nr:FtsQ-type POTRA domain-containing protein [Candidatus Saganbacteria bacterium]
MARRKRRKKKFSWYLIWFLIVSFFLAVTVILVSTLPVWQIESVRVEGNRFVDKAEILKAGNKFIGKNIFLIDIQSIRDQLKNIPLIKEVQIKRNLPNLLVIIVKERQEAAVAVINDQAVLFDDEGVILNLYQPAFIKENLPSFSNLAVIVGIRPKNIKDGRLQSDFKKLLTSVLRDFKKYLATEKIKIDISFPDDIVLLVDDFVRVMIGETTQIDEKLKAFQALRDFEQERLNSIEYIDVRVPGNPVIKFK